MKLNFDHLSFGYDFFMQYWFFYKEKLIHSLLTLDGDEVMADLGGGTGHYARYFAGYCREVHLLDASKRMLAKGKAHPKIKKYEGDVLATPFKNHFFDIVLLNDVLHHIEAQDKLLCECYRILKRGGLLVIYDFDIKQPAAKILKGFEECLFGKLFFHTPAEVERLFEPLNFRKKILKKRGYCYIFVLEST